MNRKTTSLSHFLPLDSSTRLKRVQSLLKSLKLPALVLIAGLDANQHIGTIRLINYLLCGLSGRDLPDNILFQSSLEEIFIILRPNSALIYCTPQNVQYVTEITSMWPNTEYRQAPSHLLQQDMDEVELFKISEFIRHVNELGPSGSHQTADGAPKIPIAFPLTPTEEKPNGDPMEVEKWPLIQAYALTDFAQGAFFTMRFQVHGIYHQLQKLYTLIDAQALKTIASTHLESFKNQWDNVTANFDAYINHNVDDLEMLRQVPEVDLMEPLLTAYDYADMEPRDASLRGHQMKRVLPYPRLLLGERSSHLEENKSSEETMESVGKKTFHFVVEASEPQSPLACARSYFLQMGRLPSDALLTSRLTESATDNKIVQSYECTETKLLMELYIVLIEAFNASCVSLKKANLNTQKGDLKALQESITSLVEQCCTEHIQRRIQSGNLSQTSQKILSEKYTSPKVLVQGLDLSPYVFIDERRGLPSSLPPTDYGLVYIRLSFPSISHDSHNLGGLYFGDTIAFSKRHTSSLFEEQVISLTQDIPNFTAFKADAAETIRNRDILQLLEQRTMKNKLAHPTLQRFIHTLDSFNIFFQNPIFSRMQGEMHLYTNGLAFYNRRYGVFTLSLRAVSSITLYNFPEGDPHYAEIKLKQPAKFQPFGPLMLLENDSILLHFVPASRNRRLFRSDALPEWRSFCKRNKVPIQEVEDTTASSELQQAVRVLDLEHVKLKQKSKKDESNQQRDVLNFFSFSSQTSSTVCLLDILPEFDSIVEKFQLHDSGIASSSTSSNEVEKGTKKIPLHIITGGVRSTMVHAARSLMNMASSEYGWTMIPIGGDAYLDACEEPQYDFKQFYVQLIKAIKKGRTTENMDNVHLLYLVPGFTDIERIVRGIQQLQSAKNIPIAIHSVTSCINKNLLFGSKQEEINTEALPHVLRQCTNGFVMNILITSLELEKEREVEYLLKKASPCAHVSYMSYSQPLHVYDANEILKKNLFDSERFAKARAFSTKSVGSDIKLTRIQCRPFRFDRDKLVKVLESSDLIQSTSFYFTGHAHVEVDNGDESKPTAIEYKIDGFSSQAVLRELAEERNHVQQKKANLFYFYGRRVAEDAQAIQRELETAFVPIPEPKELKTVETLTEAEINSIREKHLLDDLPGDWNFDGSMFITPEGERVRLHPQYEAHRAQYIEEENERIQQFNASIPETNIE